MDEKTIMVPVPADHIVIHGKDLFEIVDLAMTRLEKQMLEASKRTKPYRPSPTSLNGFNV